MIGALIDLNHPGRYLHWHFVSISVANLVVIGAMVALFVLAIAIPFPRHGGGDR